ncbi:hypothetical protein CsSME_00036330 [Camellia sinensis var. sinensis]
MKSRLRFENNWGCGQDRVQPYMADFDEDFREREGERKKETSGIDDEDDVTAAKSGATTAGDIMFGDVRSHGCSTLKSERWLWWTAVVVVETEIRGVVIVGLEGERGVKG